jgi:hypothetical protein
MVPVAYSCKNTPVAEPVKSDKPNSNFGGVQIGAITYSWRSMPGGVENIIKYCKEAGISSIELMSNDLENYLGAPKNPMMGMFGPLPADSVPQEDCLLVVRPLALPLQVVSPPVADLLVADPAQVVLQPVLQRAAFSAPS